MAKYRLTINQDNGESTEIGSVRTKGAREDEPILPLISLIHKHSSARDARITNGNSTELADIPIRKVCCQLKVLAIKITLCPLGQRSILGMEFVPRPDCGLADGWNA